MKDFCSTAICGCSFWVNEEEHSWRQDSVQKTKVHLKCIYNLIFTSANQIKCTKLWRKKSIALHVSQGTMHTSKFCTQSLSFSLLMLQEFHMVRPEFNTDSFCRFSGNETTNSIRQHEEMGDSVCHVFHKMSSQHNAGPLGYMLCVTCLCPLLKNHSNWWGDVYRSRSELRFAEWQRTHPQDVCVYVYT